MRGERLDVSPVSRRNALRLLATGGIGSLAGCTDLSSFESPNVGDIVIPPLEQGWFEIHENGDAAFAFQFDGDIQARLRYTPLFSKKNIGSSFEKKGYTVEFGSVDIQGTGSVPKNQLIQGTVDSFTEIHDWPVGQWYLTPRITLPSKPNALPQNNAILYIRFPDGYEYVLPRDYYAFQNWQPEIRVANESLFGYGSHDELQTFPFIEHYSYPEFVWMYRSARFKFEFLKRVGKLFSTEWYTNNGVEAATELATNVSESLVEEIIESLFMSQLSEAISIPLDIVSVRNALNAQFLTRGQMEDLTLSAQAVSQHQVWLSVLEPRETHSRGFPKLLRLCRDEIHRNQLVVGSYDSDRFQTHVEKYRVLLDNQQRSIADMHSTLTREGTRSVAQRGSRYWRNLYQYGRDILELYDEIVNEERRMLNRLRTRL